MNKKWLVIIGVVVVLAIIGAVVSGSKDKTPEPTQLQSPTQTKAEESTTEAPIDVASLDELYNGMLKATKGKEPNTSAMVDAIATYAKKAAKQGNEDVGNEAALYIANNYPDFFSSNTQMEKIMLCGYYLEYLDHSDRVTQLGQDVEQAVKYVYRGAEDVSSNATQENLDQIGEILEESGLK